MLSAGSAFPSLALRNLHHLAAFAIAPGVTTFGSSLVIVEHELSFLARFLINRCRRFRYTHDSRQKTLKLKVNAA